MKRTEKKKVIEKYAVHTKDTGSAHVQVAILTERINSLQEHLLSHPKDNHSRKGLLQIVGKRRRHFNYLRLHDKDSYEKLLKDLKLKTPKKAATRKTVKRKVATKAEKAAPKKATKKAAAKKPAAKKAPAKKAAAKKPAAKKAPAKK
ncbi:30S ribosomal protein S15 [Candidatus Peregrinibacteria bacterium]|jgi:small subunit ribosomal protein S15|nr:30S ribosomal protein S15 [Candidatus Peregrinibacteria bacterium]MBT4148733.1 30S ribosomal protein S15 [Candidatus Peregrinibacteria bacterium]MBT4366165.1 30S ribosomal protein S15 [Candidatus Peregrinibacteria bacterium]MBT4456268.1 30S ribosomal protein S15 [Candidatus Peregrinibacteria bacterium]